jgi:hypothetical protein
MDSANHGASSASEEATSVEPGILFITSPEIDLMQDIIHEGLDEILGADRVYCYPYKDYSQFQYNLTPPSPQKNLHRRPVGRRRLEEWRESIVAVVIGSIRPDALETWQTVSGLFADRPTALINGEWSPILEWPANVGYTHRFSKDLLPGDEAPGLYPLAYSAPPRAMLPEELERDIRVSFVVRDTHPLRSECAKLLAEAGFLALLDIDIPREQFCWILNRSRIAVSVRGVAWDSLRYWEIPYHGALLLSQRLPIVVPDNFVDGESAVFFDDPADMMEKIGQLLADEDRLAAIAVAGRRLSREKHTAAARARYLLDRMGLLPILGLEG